MKRERNYSNDPLTEENRNFADKYSPTGESEFSSETSHPLDEVLSERHFNTAGFHPAYRDRYADKDFITSDRGTDYRGRAPRNYQRSDQSIREEVCEILLHSPEVDASELEVFVQDAEVRLVGSVESRSMKKLTERLVENLSGVRDVRNELRIRVDFPEKEKTHRLLGDTPPGFF